ncbi:hypothetical protein QR680_016276 [Steinernema hermaphroditum]|uniref:7TM GPCR serpentine receptor class x (Srx) domain-containing protein n=1 Tax=Steinernema hermaphroditum TaxID=289476 RepID=A0AA39LM65_9BILA|nr:hypothetical protein QR680_016276 [Steinernema hermaphroditum]
MSSCGNVSFVFGCELQGKGYVTQTDTIVGSLIWLLAIAAVCLGIYNVYLIKKISIFHNSFGWFWACRTVGEIGSNAVHVIYSGPITLLQLNTIPPMTGVLIFVVGYYFACYACVMHQVVSLNRTIAVCAPLRYTTLFRKTVCAILSGYCAVVVFIAISLYLLVPCNMKGQLGKANVAMRRNVRFFFQTSIQNFTMMIALTMIVVVNNQPSPNGIYMNVLGFITIIITHINNAMALILFNPEVRARFRMQLHVAPFSTVLSGTNVFSGVFSRVT